MDQPHVDVVVVREFRAPVDKAYEWLTDYRDDDHTLTDAVVMRRNVVRKDANTVELDAELFTVGRKLNGRATVTLHPEQKRWVASIAGGKWIYEYQLTPTKGGGSRLEVHYRLGARRWTKRLLFRLATPKLKRELHQMWDGFERAMEKDLAIAPRAA